MLKCNLVKKGFLAIFVLGSVLCAQVQNSKDWKVLEENFASAITVEKEKEFDKYLNTSLFKEAKSFFYRIKKNFMQHLFQLVMMLIQKRH